MVSAGALAEDRVDGNVSTSVVVMSASVDTETIGSYEVQFSVTDAAGNEAVAVRRVEVIGNGCRDSAAFNYDPLSSWDAGNCEAIRSGCIDPDALNYDSSANSDACNHGLQCTGMSVTVTVVSALFPIVSFQYAGSSSWCECDPGFTGAHCTADADECVTSSHACPDGDACVNLAGSYTCGDCAGAFNSTTQGCDTNDGCLSSPCANGATCVDLGSSSYMCVCPIGVSGRHCTMGASGQLSNEAECNTCVARVGGCMDPLSYNFNPIANTDDGGCIGIAQGCVDPQKYNYDHTANTDDGSCVDFVYGCLDKAAYNYNPLANCGTERWSRSRGVLRGCIDFSLCIRKSFGCPDLSMRNYGPSVTTDDGSCQPFIHGCTDPRAVNYDPACNTDDDSCTLLGCMDATAENFVDQANGDDGSCVISGCTNTRAANYLASATDDDGGCIILGCLDVYSVSFDSHANTDDGSCAPTIVGCMDPVSSNYRQTANVDDGSCVGRCINDVGWSDSDGEGCNQYYLGYCGFEDSAKRCPTVCGSWIMREDRMVCSVDVRLGCDGIAGSTAKTDACGICNGDNSSCTSCSSARQFHCNRSVSPAMEFGNGSAADTAGCKGRILELGGRAILGSSVISKDDCGRELPAWQVYGYRSQRSCMLSQSECADSDSDFVAAENSSSASTTCLYKHRSLTNRSWESHCTTAMSRTAVQCDEDKLESLRRGSGCDIYNISAASTLNVTVLPRPCRDISLEPPCAALVLGAHAPEVDLQQGCAADMQKLAAADITKGCLAFRTATGCEPPYSRTMDDLFCAATIPVLADGYCECAHGDVPICADSTGPPRTCDQECDMTPNVENATSQVKDYCAEYCDACPSDAGPGAESLPAGVFGCTRLPCSFEYELEACVGAYTITVVYANPRVAGARHTEGPKMGEPVNLRSPGSMSINNETISYELNSTTTHSIQYLVLNVHLQDGANVLRVVDYGGAQYYRFEFQRTPHRTLTGFELSTLADFSGVYNYNVSVSLGNGIFASHQSSNSAGLDHTMPDCEPTCVLNMFDVNEAWEWVEGGKCWSPVLDTTHPCLAPVLVDFAARRVDSFCPTQVVRSSHSMNWMSTFLPFVCFPNRI